MQKTKVKAAIFLFGICLVLCLSIFSTAGIAQPLFESDEILKLTLRGPITTLLADRGEDPQNHAVELTYSSTDNKLVVIPVKIRVRGNFRRLKSNCHFPPLMLNFSNETTGGTIFEGQDKLKLVVPCQGDKFVVHEYLVYELLNCLTPYSFRARLVQFQFDDSELKEKDREPFYGILLEEDVAMAARNKMVLIERKLVRPEQTQRTEFLTVAMFEYFIANTDWSVQYQQNIKLIASDSLSIPIAVPYDFDHAGLVNAPYAKPAPELELSSTRERRYRGFCIQQLEEFDPIIKVFKEKKTELYSVYQNNELIDEKYRKTSLEFLEKFYETLNDPRRLKSALQYPCDPYGTGNVVIKGLKQ